MDCTLTNLKPFWRSILGKSNFWVITFTVIPIFGPFFLKPKPVLLNTWLKSNAREFVFVEREKKTPLSVIAIASDRQEKIDEKASVLVDISNELLEQHSQKRARLAAKLHELTQKAAELGDTVHEQQHRLVDISNEQLDQNSQKRARLAAELHELTQKTAQVDDTVHEQQHQVEALRQSCLSIEWLSKFAAGNKYFPTPPLDMVRHVGSVNEENFREVGMILVCDLIQLGLLTNPMLLLRISDAVAD